MRSGDAEASPRSITSAPESSSRRMYGIRRLVISFDHLPMIPGSVMVVTTMFSAPTIWLSIVSGHVTPAITGASSPWLFERDDTAPETTPILSDTMNSDGDGISDGSDDPFPNGSIVNDPGRTFGDDVRVPRSTSHPNASASTVTQNGTRTESNPNMSACADPSLAILSGSEWAIGQGA